MKSFIIEGYNSLYVIYENGEIYNMRTGKKVKPYTNNVGYYRVGFYKDGKRIQKYLHRLLAEAFIPNLENKEFINHIDGNPANNDLSNLEWCTRSENTLHAYKLGLNYTTPMYGEQNRNSILNNNIVLDIRKKYNSGIKQTEIAKNYNISRQIVNGIVKNKTWKHLN
jgi:hypothetical protein